MTGPEIIVAFGFVISGHSENIGALKIESLQGLAASKKSSVGKIF